MNDAAAGTERPITIAVMAMGGQGGGVLADWIVAMAEAGGWVAQTTSVPGVAQRTGATIYYVELIRPQQRNAPPVLSLMPVPGDVDVVIAAELMEAGRAIQRGLVTDRTTLIASSHRSYAVTEKARPGDGRADGAAVLATAADTAGRFLHADMQTLAEGSGSVISAALFGALAGSGALPFAPAEFEATIRAAGVGVDASLRAFAAGSTVVTAGVAEAAPSPLPAPAIAGGRAAERAELARALDRIARDFPADAHAMLLAGVRRLVDYQDVAYAHDYLDRVARFAVAPDLAAEAARQIAVALAYDDVIRVADLKTRPSRGARVRDEVQAAPDHIVETTEFLHPRAEEICATLPAGIGRAVEASPALMAALRRFARGQRVRSSGIFGFTLLWLVAGLRPWRRRLLRHGREMAHVEAWLALAAAPLGRDDRLALEILKCRRLVKGYSDTHARGQSKFDKVTGAVPRLAGRADAADWVRRLREAALADPEGSLLDGALRTVAQL